MSIQDTTCITASICGTSEYTSILSNNYSGIHGTISTNPDAFAAKSTRIFSTRGQRFDSVGNLKVSQRARRYGGFRKWWYPPNHPFAHRVFHYFHHPFWGIPIFWKHPYKKMLFYTFRSSLHIMINKSIELLPDIDIWECPTHIISIHHNIVIYIYILLMMISPWKINMEHNHGGGWKIIFLSFHV